VTERNEQIGDGILATAGTCAAMVVATALVLAAVWAAHRHLIPFLQNL
jgi:hypothetical protein